MASFTDRIQEFNPYVQQLPIDAMLYVGQQKQQAYDQGVQKIQAQIDQVAGMDVVRDIDKQYLQSTLNQLGGNLRKVAAGDFSNFQLQNSVGGMIKSIGRDPLIQNAVGSTARYRKGITDMETARKEGKSSPSNEYVFNRSAQEWMQNKDPKASFSGDYKQYSNWKKNGLEVLKALTKDETITDDAFTTDGKGNIVIADATVRKKLSGISPEKIQQALMVGLTPADFDQMGIDGVYNYANADGKTFYNHVNSAREATVKHYTDQRATLENAKSSTTSVPERAKLDAQIADLDKTIRGVNSEYVGINQAIQGGNLDAAKAQYFTRNSIDGFAKAFAFTETSQTYETSPFAVAQRWREDKAQDWKKFMLGYEQDERFHGDTMAAKMAEIAAKGDKGGLGTLGGVAGPVDKEDVPFYTVAKMMSQLEPLAASIASDKATFIQSKQKDEEWYDAQYKAYKERPSALAGDIAEHFRGIENKERVAKMDVNVISEISRDAYTRFGDIDKLIPKDAEHIIANGVDYSPREIVDFNTKLRKYISTGGSFVGSSGTGGGKGTVYDYDKAEQELSPKEYHLFELMGSKKAPTNADDKELLKQIRNYSNTVNQPYAQTLDNINKYTADEINKRVTTNQQVRYSIGADTPAEQKRLGGALYRFTQNAEKTGGLPSSPDFDIDKAKKLAVDPKALFTIDVIEGTSRDPQGEKYKVHVLGEDKTEVSFTMTPEQKKGILGSDFESSREVKAIRPYQEIIRLNGGVTTNFGKTDSNHNTAYLNNGDFGNVRNYGISGDLVQTPSGGYALQINVYDPISGQWYDNISATGNKVIVEQDIAKAMQQLTDATIFEMLTETPPTAADLKQVEQASKKPL